MSKVCENCKGQANVYAMDTYAGGWGGYYCNSHTPTGFQITDQIKGKGENK
jgi:hypothetical protein